MKGQETSNEEFNIEEEIKKDDNKQPISNCEASFFMHLGYKELLEEKDKNYEELSMNPVFKEFLEYFKMFPNLRFGNNLEIEELSDALNDRKSSLKNKREELLNIEGLKESEIVLLINLKPSSVSEAITWIPSLKKKISQGKSKDISQALEIISKYSTIEFNN